MAIQKISPYSSAISQSKTAADKTRRVAEEFESLFTGMMLKAMRKTVPEDSLFPSSMADKIYTDMLDTEYAGLMSKHGSFGLADLIVKQIEKDNGQTSSLDALRSLSTIDPWMLDNAFIPSGNASFQSNKGWSVDQWDSLVSEASNRYGVDKNLIKAVMTQESSGNPYAVSRAGAKGLMQLIDSTAAEMGVNDSFNPRDNIMGGTAYLRKLLDRFDGDVIKSLAGYNAGPSAVEEHNGVPPYPETQDYVKRVIDYKNSLSAASGPVTQE